jgi:hypothetical protein
MQRNLIAALCALFVACTAQAGLFGTGSLEKSVKLPSEELGKLKGTAKIVSHEPVFNLPDDFVASIYNGTDWNIVDIEVTITAKGESRIFKLSKWGMEGTEFYENGNIKKAGKPVKIPGAPLTSSDFQVDIGAFLSGLPKDQWSWSIRAVYGFKN